MAVPEGQWKLFSYTIDRTGYEKETPASEKKEKEEPQEGPSLLGAMRRRWGNWLSAAQAPRLAGARW